jgi:hypothetical protein
MHQRALHSPPAIAATALTLLVALAVILLGMPAPAAHAAAANDNFASAEVISGSSGSVAGSTVGATGEANEKTPFVFQTPLTTVWYRWTAPASGRALFDISASDFDTVLEIYKNGSSLTTITDIMGDDDSSPSGGGRSLIRLNVSAGTVYWLQVDGKADTVGSFTLTWSLLAPLANDNFADAIALTDTSGSLSGDNILATSEPGEPILIGYDTVWYSFSPAQDGDLDLEMTNPVPYSLATSLYIWTGTAVNTLTYVTSDVGNGENNLCAKTFPVQGGTKYYIRVDGIGSNEQGSFTLGWEFIPDTVDATKPSVTIEQAASQPDPTTAGPIYFTVVFSEPVAGFATGDVSLGGTAGASAAAVSETAPNDGTTYTVTVSGMSASGTVTATVAAGVAQDLAGNPNNASTSTDNTVTYTAPAPAYNTYDQLDSHIVYTPSTWTEFLKPGLAYLDSYSRSSAPGASATVYFHGTRLDWIGMKGTTTGVVDVYLDGVKKATVNLTGLTSATYQTVLWSTGTISDGDHYVTLMLSGSSPAGRFITLDAVKIWGHIR